LEEFGMPTLLWRVLRAAGYPEGMEPRYFWNKEQLGDAVLINVEVVVEARDNDSTWNGSYARSMGTTPAEGASRAAFMVLSEIMDDHPQELATAMVGVFPRGDPYMDEWAQFQNDALERGTIKQQNSDNTAMTAMFAMMKTYRYAERCYGKMAVALSKVKDQKRQLQRNFDTEVERLNQELARVTLAKIFESSRMIASV
jgi:hypothetical protein